MRMKLLAALASVSLLSLAACGQDGSDTSPGSELTGDPIVIGAVGGYTGNLASSIGMADEALQTWADYVNDNGGINGHPVKLVIKDDAGDPAKSLQAVKELVEQDKVIAIVGNASLVTTSWMDYVTKKKVPVIGGQPVEVTAFTSPNSFPTGTNAPSLIVAQFARMQEEGLSKMGIMYCAEAPVCASLVPLAKASAALVGSDLEVAYGTKVSASQPSYSAECLAAKEAGVDTLFSGVAAPAVSAIADSCSQVGYQPTYSNQLSGFPVATQASQALNGTMLSSPTVNYLDESNPTVKRYLGAITQYEPELRDSPQLTPNTFWSWLGGEMFQRVAEHADLGPESTSADVYEGLYQIKDETLDGAIPPTTYVEGQPTFQSCWFDVDLEDDQFKSVAQEPSCLTEDQVAGLNKVLASAR